MPVDSGQAIAYSIRAKQALYRILSEELRSLERRFLSDSEQLRAASLSEELAQLETEIGDLIELCEGEP